MVEGSHRVPPDPFFFSSQDTLTDQDTTDGDAKREYDFNKLLKGPATFIRLEVSAACQLFFWHPVEKQWTQFRSNPTGTVGIPANRTMRVFSERWQKIQIVGPPKTGVTIYASRIIDGAGLGVEVV